MEIIHLSLNNIKPIKKLVLCLGYFDGIHIGHQAVIKTALDNSFGGSVGVLTFSVAPNAFLKKYKQEKVLTSIEDRARILADIGVDYLFVLEFNDTIARLSADDFSMRVINKLKPHLIVCGEDYHFGTRASGNYKTLRKYFNVEVTPLFPSSSSKVSSTQIINMLKEGQVDLVKEYLGYRYTVEGKVIKGSGIGTKELVPTINVELTSNYFLPKNGVYYIKAFLNEDTYFGLANIGTNPTIQNLEEPRLEVYLQNFSKEVYGQRIRIEFRIFIRDEIHFASIKELKEQIEKDIKLIDVLKLQDSRLTTF